MWPMIMVIVLDISICLLQPCDPTPVVIGDGVDNDCDGLADEELCTSAPHIGKHCLQIDHRGNFKSVN